ncbi:MAG: hypothetical protein NZ826_02250 [Thermodesulfovibrio sp.]|nr:hypothetical protein [Thermodesulfovibrio sp.]MDW7972437.1 hypothetical protein [Thermodesulfovibrio sp.]
MGKRIRLFLDENDYDLLERLAKVSGKSISQFAREILLSGLKQEMKDTQLLNRLIQKPESLSEPQRENQLNVTILVESMRQYFRLLLDAFLVMSNYFFIDRTKGESFSKEIEELKEKF